MEDAASDLKFKVGSEVIVGKDRDEGIVRFLGGTEFASGTWVGIELHTVGGKNDGSIKGVRYFECQDGKGIFVRPNVVSPVKTEKLKKNPTKKRLNKSNTSDSKASITDRERLESDVAASSDMPPTPDGAAFTDGAVSPGSPASPVSPDMVIPLEGPEAKKKMARSSTAGKEKKNIKGKGGIKKATTVIEARTEEMLVLADSKEPDVTDSHQAFKPHQRVGIFNQFGIVRFVGATNFADGIWIGIEFDEPIGKCDGTIGGRRYFSCNKDHGIFLLAPDVTINSVELSTSAKRPSQAHAKVRPHPPRRMSSMHSSPSEPVIVADSGNNILITDDEGKPVDLEDFIKNFEDTYNYVEELRELLEEAHEREQKLRRDLSAVREGAENTSFLPNPSLPQTIVAADSFADNLILLTESRKMPVHLHFPKSTTAIYSYFEVKGKLQGCENASVCFFGLQYYLKKFLAGEVITDAKIEMAENIIVDHYRYSCPSHPRIFNRSAWEHIAKAHKGHLPILIKSVPEGTVIAENNVLFTIENTDAKCYWLPVYLEALLAQVWYPTSVATRSREQRDVFAKYLRNTGSDDVVDRGMLKFKLHDYGFRGGSSLESATLGGMAHLVNFEGSECLASVIACKDYYRCDMAAHAIPCVNHATMSAWGSVREPEAFRNLLDQHPKGYVACVCDTWDLVNAIECSWGEELQEMVVKRDGTVFLVPDTADDAKAISKVLEGLGEKFPYDTTSTGHKILPPCIRVLHRDGGVHKMKAILEGLMGFGWAADNLAFYSNSMLQQNMDLDQPPIAFRCGSAMVDGRAISLRAEPGARNRKGRVSVECDNGVWKTIEDFKGDPKKDQLTEVFKNGKLLIEDPLASIRRRSDGEVVPVVAPGINAPKGRGKAPGRVPPNAPRRTATYLKATAEKGKSIAEDLLGQVGRLKKVQLKQEKNSVSDADVAQYSKIYEQLDGDLKKIAQFCDIPDSLLEKNPPKDAEDFARMLLSGNYTGEKSDVAKQDLKKRLQDALTHKKSMLKRTTTKIANGEASCEDVQICAALFVGASGDLEQLARKYDLSLDRLLGTPPNDAEDFAKRLLAGEYTEDRSACAVRNFREALQGKLKQTVTSLRRTTTKEKKTFHADPQDVLQLANLFRQNRGNIDHLARICGASVSLMRKNMPSDPDDFAYKMLSGVFTGDSGGIARAELRDRLREDLVSKQSQLNRVKTKENVPLPQAEIDKIATWFLDRDGDLEEIAHTLGIPVHILEGMPPSDGHDFAVNLMSGTYATLDGEDAKRRLRDELLSSLMRTKSKLKRTTTKSNQYEHNPMELAFAGRIYETHNGNYQAIAKQCGLSLVMLESHAPQDSETFALGLFEGLYIAEKSEEARRELRDHLKADLNNQISKLKPAVVRETKSHLTSQEMAKITSIYTKARGNVDLLAQQFGLSADLLRGKPPVDGADFVRKLFHGEYTAEQTAISKAMWREHLRDGLNRQITSLRTVKTKVSDNVAVAAEDVETFAEVYTKVNGNFDKLATMFGVDADLLKSKNPTSARDFAVKLLSGEFTGEKSELQRKFLIKRLKGDLQSCMSTLRRTTTQEKGLLDIQDEDVQMVARIYNKFNGNLSAIARAVGLHQGVIQDDPPVDADDFARKLLLGSYLRDMTEVAKKKLRKQIVEDASLLKKMGSQLRKTSTRIGVLVEATEAETASIVKVYNECRGNYKHLAQYFGATIDMIKKYPPTDALDFTKKLLEGTFTGDLPAVALARMRECLREELQIIPGKLRKTTTKERKSTDGPSMEEIEFVRKIYIDFHSDAVAAAEHFGLDKTLVEQTMPKSAEEFARKVLSGAYSIDSVSENRAKLRNVMKGEIQKKKTNLKRVISKEPSGVANLSDLEHVCKICQMYNSDYDAIIQKFELNRQLLRENYPVNDNDFARKLLMGNYTTDDSEEAKAKLRRGMKEDLTRKKSLLKRTETKVGTGEARPQDIAYYSKIFLDHRGNFESLSRTCEIHLEMLRSDPPKDERDFALKVLKGNYSAEKQDMATAKLRQGLKEDINGAFGQLKRTTTKEGGDAPSPELVRAWSKVYTDNDADIKKISAMLGIPDMVIEQSRPVNAEDFAWQLLQGWYDLDDNAYSQAVLRDNLADDIQTAGATLHRTTTKELKGRISEEDIQCVAKVYREKGDKYIQELVMAGAINKAAFDANPPNDAPDFSRKLLSGVWTKDNNARQNIREVLKGCSSKQLAKTTTKEYKSLPSGDDIALFANAYRQVRGDPDKLFELFGGFGIDKSLLRKMDPESPEDFAEKLLIGAFSGDQNLVARTVVRDTLRNELKKANSQLRKTKTKIGTGPTQEDLEQIAALYVKNKGDLSKLAEILNAGNLIEENPPIDAMDFAVKVLKGTYTVDVLEMAKAVWREGLQECLQETKSRLNRSNTTVHDGSPFKEDVNSIAQLFRSVGGDLQELAAQFGIAESVLEESPPEDGHDFATRLLTGEYSIDATAVNKRDHRRELDGQIKKTMSQLKRTTTKEATGAASKEDTEHIAALFLKCGGMPDILSEVFSIDLALLEYDVPENGEEFAVRLLGGYYDVNATEFHKANHRDYLRGELKTCGSSLKRTETKTNQPLAQNDADITALARLFDKHRGMYDSICEGLGAVKLAEMCGISAELLKEDAPKTGRDFAMHLFEGKYSVDQSEEAKEKLRKRLPGALQQQTTNLRKTRTKEYTGQAAKEDIEAAASIYTNCSGNLEKLAQVLKVKKTVFDGKPPENAYDFARKLLAGDYSVDALERARSDLRLNLRTDLHRTITQGLHRTTTKEATGEATEEDIAKVVAVYERFRGDHTSISNKFRISHSLLRKYEPVDARDFAKKLLTGVYCSDMSEMARAMFRQKLVEDLQMQSAALKKTRTKENRALTEADTLSASLVYTRERGDLDRIAKNYNLSRRLLDKNPPKDAMDFAEKLLSGDYSSELESKETARLERSYTATERRKGKGPGAIQRTESHDKGVPKATPEQIDHIMRIYAKCYGDLEEVARICGLDADLLYPDPPKDCQDFAEKFLSGAYSLDAAGQPMNVQIQRKVSTLMKVKTKECTGNAMATDIDLLAALYKKHHGDLEALADVISNEVGAPKERDARVRSIENTYQLLMKSPPMDAEDFAIKLLGGFYYGDSTAIAMEDHRNNLREQLRRSLTINKLRRTRTKETTGKATQVDIDAVLAILSKEYHVGTDKPDLAGIAAKFTLSLPLMQECDSDARNDPKKFAARLLTGMFSQDKDSSRRKEFRGQLADQLKTMQGFFNGALKKTKTKEGTGDATPNELASLIKLYDEYYGDLQSLAEKCGVSHVLLERYPPVDGTDFARKLLSGTYSADRSELAREQMREMLESELGRKKTGLKRVTTKESRGEATAEDINSLTQLYTYWRGSLEELAVHTGADLEFMRMCPPDDAEDFARNLLGGMYTGESAQLAQATLRANLRHGLKKMASKLKRTTTKEGGGPSESDIQMFAGLYHNNDGDFELLSELCGLDLELLINDNPSDGRAFALNLLAGNYLADHNATSQAMWRRNLKIELDRTQSVLKRTKTKVGEWEPSAEDLAQVSTIFDDANGSLETVAAMTGLPIEMFRGTISPKDGTDFAKKLFSGFYTQDEFEASKHKLRRDLASDVNRTMSTLKKTTTKEGSARPSADDIMMFEAIFEMYGADLQMLASKLHCPVDLLKKNRPSNGTDFARKLMDGYYTPGGAPITKEEKDFIAYSFGGDLTRSLSTLKRTTTKEGPRAPTKVDLDPVIKLWDKYDGNLETLAAVCKVDVHRLKATKPPNGLVFAKGLLAGSYLVDADSSTRQVFRANLADQLQRTSTTLKKVETRMGGGPSGEEVKFMMLLYTREKGNLDTIARMIGMSSAPLKRNPPNSPEEFAERILCGAYTVDMTAQQQQELRNRLGTELNRAMTGLRRTSTKELKGEVSEQDVVQFAKMYTELKGDLDALAKKFNLDAFLLKENNVSGPKDFARKLLEGWFSGDTSALGRATLRARLREDLQMAAGRLKRVETKKYGGPSQEDLVLAGEVWEKLDGDSRALVNIVAIAKSFDVSADLIIQRPPRDKHDFAMRVLSGLYTLDPTQQKPKSKKAQKRQRRKLRKVLKKKAKAKAKPNARYSGPGPGPPPQYDIEEETNDDNGSEQEGDDSDWEPIEPLTTSIQRQMTSLNRTTTKEAQGLNVDEVNAMAQVYNRNNGDLFALARVCGVPYTLFQERPPKDARDWAVKVLEGYYEHDSILKNKDNFRKKIQEELVETSGTLRRTETKTGGDLKPEDIEVCSKIYAKCKGKLSEIASMLKIEVSVLERNLPKDATDFAKKLLTGVYEADMDLTAKQQFLSNLKNQKSLVQRQSTLNRVSTKTYSGQLDPDDVRMCQELWDKHKGNIKELAEALGVHESLMRHREPEDAATFAKQLLTGAYSSEIGAFEAKVLRQHLADVLRGGARPNLKRTITRTYTGAPKESEVKAVAELYESTFGDWELLAQRFGLDAEIISQNPPEDGEDFGTKVLDGTYGSFQKEQLRQFYHDVRDSLPNASGKLKRTTTKEGTKEPLLQDMAVVADIYEQHGSNLGKLVALTGASAAILRRNPPKDGQDFARRLLMGLYNDN